MRIILAPFVLIAFIAIAVWAAIVIIAERNNNNNLGEKK